MSSEFLFKDGMLETTLHNHEIQTPFISYVIFKAVPFLCPMTPANWPGPITLSEHCTGHLVCPSEDPQESLAPRMCLSPGSAGFSVQPKNGRHRV